MGVEVVLGKKTDKRKLCIFCFTPILDVCSRSVLCSLERGLVSNRVIVVSTATEYNIEGAVDNLFKLLFGNTFRHIAVGYVCGEGSRGCIDYV